MAGHDALNGHVLPDDEQMIARALGDEDEPDKSKDPMEEWGEEALDDDIEDIEDIEDINGATGAPTDFTGEAGAARAPVRPVEDAPKSKMADDAVRGYSEYADLHELTIGGGRGLEQKTSWGADAYEEWEEREWDDKDDSTHRFYRPQTTPRYPPTFLVQMAAHGVVDKVVGAVAAQSEADPMAILIQFLAAFGSYVGRRA